MVEALAKIASPILVYFNGLLKFKKVNSEDIKSLIETLGIPSAPPFPLRKKSDLSEYIEELLVKIRGIIRETIRWGEDLDVPWFLDRFKEKILDELSDDGMLERTILWYVLESISLKKEENAFAILAFIEDLEREGIREKAIKRLEENKRVSKKARIYARL